MKKLYSLALSFALLALVACSDNLFGSSSPSKDDSVESLRIDAENAFRKGDYQKSYDICSKIVAKDSTASYGYFGMAKASLWLHNINPFSIFSLIKPEDGQCPFMGEPIKVQNDYFQAMKDIVSVLSKLDRRDSLTAIYDLYINAKESGQSLDTRLYDFESKFCSNGKTCRDTINNNEKFPLSDREYKSSYFGGILLLSVFTKWFLNFFDTNEDDCIALAGKPGIDNPGSNKDREGWGKWEKWGCNPIHDIPGNYDYDLPLALECPKDANGNMSVVINHEKILEALQAKLNDYYDKIAACSDATCNANNPMPPEIENLNKKIDEFQGTFEEVEDVLGSLGLSGSGDGEDDGLKDGLNKYKAYASFYKVGTHIDEDGDGCIDEELLDGRDNDGDFLVNENPRIAPTDLEHSSYGIKSGKYGINSINNSMVGNNPYRDAENWEYNTLDTLQRPTDPVKICNSPNCLVYTPILPKNDDDNFVTVLRFTQMNYPGTSQKYWTSRDLDLKLQVAQDTVCPPEIPLTERKRTIGGCWPNYDECKFVKYVLRRELAIPDVQKTRVHPSCASYKYIECPP
jgi:hypothetical protein